MNWLPFATGIWRKVSLNRNLCLNFFIHRSFSLLVNWNEVCLVKNLWTLHLHTGGGDTGGMILLYHMLTSVQNWSRNMVNSEIRIPATLTLLNVKAILEGNIAQCSVFQKRKATRNIHTTIVQYKLLQLKSCMQLKSLFIEEPRFPFTQKWCCAGAHKIAIFRWNGEPGWRSGSKY